MKGAGRQGGAVLAGGGDRALALLTWFARAWDFLNGEQARGWAKDAVKDFEAAVAGNSRLRKAVATALGDETSQELVARLVGALVDVKSFCG